MVTSRSKQPRTNSRIRITLFSHTAEVQANFLGGLQKLKDLRIDRDVEQISSFGNMTVTPGFTIFLVQGQAESNTSGIVALELAPANDNANGRLVNLIELLCPPTDSAIDKDEKWDIKIIQLPIRWSIAAESPRENGFINSMEVILSLYLQAAELFQTSFTMLMDCL